MNMIIRHVLHVPWIGQMGGDSFYALLEHRKAELHRRKGDCVSALAVVGIVTTHAAVERRASILLCERPLLAHNDMSNAEFIDTPGHLKPNFAALRAARDVV